METQYKDILYKSENDLGTLESKIYFILEWKWNLIGFDYIHSIKNLWDNIDLYDLNLGNYILQSDELDKLENIKENLIKNWVEILWSFEYKNNFYLILHKPKIKWDINIIDEQNIEVSNEVQKVVWKVEGIL